MVQTVKPTLLVMAAGMGSRYGGLKQLDQFGPNGETIMEYSVFDAIRAGFGKVVFVIRREFEAAFKNALPARLSDQILVEFVLQEPDKLPEGFVAPADRIKPWGTGHAVWVAQAKIKEPFAVINGDDFYGKDSFEIIAHFLKNTSGEYALAGYRLANTLSENGTVARGICEVDEAGYLKSVTERTSIHRSGTGVVYTDESGNEVPLSGKETVSMNLMGFTPSLFGYCTGSLVLFLRERGKDPKAEFYLPGLVNELIRTGRVRMKVLPTPATWFGVTYAGDKPVVMQKIAQLVREGVYPEKLWR